MVSAAESTKTVQNKRAEGDRGGHRQKVKKREVSKGYRDKDREGDKHRSRDRSRDRNRKGRNRNRTRTRKRGVCVCVCVVVVVVNLWQPFA